MSTRTYIDFDLIAKEPFRATHLHSPGWNEGKARNGTLGTRRQTRIELRRSGTNRASVWFVSLRFVALHSLGKCRSYGAQKCGGNNYPRACALGFEKVSPLQGFSLSINVSKMILQCIIVGFLGGGVPPLCRTFLSSLRNHLYLLFHALALACPQAGAYRVSYYSYLCKDLILGML